MDTDGHLWTSVDRECGNAFRLRRPPFAVMPALRTDVRPGSPAGRSAAGRDVEHRALI